MSNLLPIETEFVNNFRHNGTTLTALHRLQEAEGDLKKKQFEKSLAQAPLVRSAVEHFKSDEGKAQLAEAGLTWTYGDFVKKALRYSDRSNANLLIRIADRNDPSSCWPCSSFSSSRESSCDQRVALKHIGPIHT